MDRNVNSVGLIEHEVTLFLRRVEAGRTVQTLDRSAYLLLGELEARGPLAISALAQTFQLDISTASRQTTALESKGLVERLPNPEDARVSFLRITPLGRAEFEATHAARMALFCDVLDDWQEEDRLQFAVYLKRFNQDLVKRRRAPLGEDAPVRRGTE